MLARKDVVKVAIPDDFRDRYIIRCTAQKYGFSSKNNPMVTLDWEIVGYQTTDGQISTKLKRGESVYEIGGASCQTWHTLSESALEMYFHNREVLGLGQTEEVDETNPPLDYLGITAHAILDADPSEQRKAPTPEQKAAGKPGDLILDPVTNQPIKRNRVRVAQILGRANIGGPQF